MKLSEILLCVVIVLFVIFAVIGCVIEHLEKEKIKRDTEKQVIENFPRCDKCIHCVMSDTYNNILCDITKEDDVIVPPAKCNRFIEKDLIS